MLEKEIPDWYGKHDNPHHAGMRSHLRRIASCEDEMLEELGVRAKHITLPVRQLPKGEIFNTNIDTESPQG